MTSELPKIELNFIEKLSLGLEYISNLFSNIEVVITIIMIIIMIISVALTAFFYVKRVNEKSKEKIDKLIKEKKYIRGLFVELNDSKENLRYFVHRGKWKKRIVKDFNALFSDKYGLLLKEVFQFQDVSFYLPVCYNIDKIVNVIEHTRLFINKLENDDVDYSSKYKDSMVIYQKYSNNYDKILLQLRKRAEYIKNRYVVLIGSAGNGKTNLLCSISELLFQLKYPCVYMNAKEIDTNIDSYFGKQLNLIDIVIKHDKCMLAVKMLGKLRRKPTYIIIDAVNENNDDDFYKSLPPFINKLLEEKNVRVLITCRSEYFEARYKKVLINNTNHQPICDNIQEQNYSQNGINRMFDIYSKEFEFKGKLSGVTKHKLSQQLLLMRMFFETHVDSEEVVSDLDQYALYDQYIKQVGKEKKVDVREFMDEVAGLMTDKHNYSYVSEELISKNGLQTYEKIDGTILTSKTLIYHKNSLMESEESVIYFVFDEMRDYCIARYNLKRMCVEKDELPDSDLVLQFLDGLNNEEATCFEGVVNYVYREFKQRNDEHLCSEIMENYIKPSDIQSSGRNYMSNEELKGWGLKLIFENPQKQLKCEKSYLKYIVYENPAKLLSALFAFLVFQEKEQGWYTLEVLFELMREIRDNKLFLKVLDECTDMWGRDGTISHTDFERIDEDLHSVTPEALQRFRHFEILYLMFFDWKGKKQLIEQIKKDCDIVKVKTQIKGQYYIFKEDE